MKSLPPLPRVKPGTIDKGIGSLNPILIITFILGLSLLFGAIILAAHFT